MEKFLHEKQIAISISESEEIRQLGYSDTHTKDAMIEFARHLLIQGATLVYGGDLRVRGFTELFADLSEQYRLDNEDTFPFINYFSFPIHLNITKEQEVEFKSQKVKVIRVKQEATLNVNPTTFVEPNSSKNKYVWAKSLTKMRQDMNDAIVARVATGGRNFDYLGKYPGIIQEAKISLESRTPLYLIGAFGGATQKMIDAIIKSKDVINPELPFYKSTENQLFREYFNARNVSDEIDFSILNKFFIGLNIGDLNNGLDIKENQRLFTTSHIPEMVFLVLKGLRQVLR